MSSLHCDADTGSGIVALCSWASHVLRNDASLALPLASACSDGSASRCLEYLQTGRLYSSLLSALGGPVIPSSPAAAVALVSHLSSMRNDASRLRAAAAVVAAGGLTASGHLRVLEAAACADAFRNAPVSSPRDIEDCLLEWLCYCQAHFSESIGGTLPSLLANDDLLLDCADGIAIFCVLAVHAPWTRHTHKRIIMQPKTLSDRLSNLHIVLALCAKMQLPVFIVAEQLAAPRPQFHCAVLVWVSYVYSLLTHRRSDVPAASICAAAAAANSNPNNAPEIPTSGTPVATSRTPSPQSAATPSFFASPSPRKQLSFASSIVQSQPIIDSFNSFKTHDSLPNSFSSLHISSSPNKSHNCTTGSRMLWGSGPVHRSLSNLSPHAAATSSHADISYMVSRDVSSPSAACFPLHVALPTEMSPQAQDNSARYLQSDASSSNTSPVAASPLPNTTAGRSGLMARDSVELASHRLHLISSSSPSDHTLPLSLPAADSVSAEDHLVGVYSPRNPSWSPAPPAPPVLSPSDGPLARALSHASPFKSNLIRSGSSNSPVSRSGVGDAAGSASSSTDTGAAIIARMKLQDSLALSLNSPLRDKQHQQRVTSAPSSVMFNQSFVTGQDSVEKHTIYQQEFEHEKEQIGESRGGSVASDESDDVHHFNGVRDDRSSQGQVWRLSTDSQWWIEGADAERPFTQSLGPQHDANSAGDHGDGNGFLESPGRHARIERSGSCAQILRVGTAGSDTNEHSYNNGSPTYLHTRSYSQTLHGRFQASSPSASQHSISSSYGVGQSSTQSFTSNRLSSGEGGSGSGSHETDILVVTTPPSLRSSTATASRYYSPTSSTRSPFSVDPAPSFPLSPRLRMSSSTTDVSSPLARARHVLELSSETLSLGQEEEEQSHLNQDEQDCVEVQNEAVEEENEQLQRDVLPPPQQQYNQFHISANSSKMPAASPTLPTKNAPERDFSSHHTSRPRPSTGGARVEGGVCDTTSAQRGFVQVGAAGASATAGAWLPSSHVPEIRGESAATARVLLQVAQARQAISSRLARDEAATLTWRRDVGVRAIAAVLGQGASGRATLDGSSCSKAAFGVSNAAAPSLSHHPFAQVEQLGIEHAATSITPSIFSSEVTTLEAMTHESQDQHKYAPQQQHQQQQQQQQEPHHRSTSASFLLEARASSSSPCLASSPVPRSPISEFIQRSPSPCSLAGSSSSLTHEQLRRVGSSSRSPSRSRSAARSPSYTSSPSSLTIRVEDLRTSRAPDFAAAAAAHSNGVRLDVMPTNCAFRPPSPPTSTSRSRSSSIGGSSSKVSWKESLKPESSVHSPAAVFFHHGSVGSSPDEPMPVPHRDIPRPIPASQSTNPRTAAAAHHPRPATHGVASGTAAAAGVSGYMPPKLSTLAPKLKGGAASKGAGIRPSTTHAASCGVGKEAKAVKPYNSTDNAKYVRNAVCDRLLAGPVLQREREDVLRRLSHGDYVQWVLLLTRDMPFKLRGIYGVQADGLLALAMGVGPAVITSAMSQEFLKYDVGAKEFKSVAAKEVGPTTLAVRLLPQFYDKRFRAAALE